MTFIIAITVVSFLFIFGSFNILQSRKINAKLLLFLGLGQFLMGIMIFGSATDFLSLLLLGKNQSPYVLAYTTFIPIPFVALCFTYIGLEILLPNKKQILTLIFLILAIIYEILIIIGQLDTFLFIYPEESGNNLIYYYMHPNSIGNYIQLFFSIIILVINGIGLIVKGIQTHDAIRKNYFLFGLSNILLVISFYLEADPNLTGIWKGLLPRVGYIITFIIMYFAIREKKVDVVKVKKEIKVEGGLFRTSKMRPDNLTEEEVTISREKKICLVCKGDVARLNYICPQCGTFYCVKCYQALSNLENTCWACDHVLDDSRPAKKSKDLPESEIEQDIIHKKN